MMEPSVDWGGDVLAWLDYRVGALVGELSEEGEVGLGKRIEGWLEFLQGRLAGAPWRSKELWRLRKPEREAGTGELGWAIELSRARSELYWEVPAASGVFDESGRRHKRACVDLVQDLGDGRFVLVELKKEADTPEYAAAELLRNYVLYLLAKRMAPEELVAGRALLQASGIELQVWAPERYYRGRACGQLERRLSEGLQEMGADFSFRIVREDGTGGVNWGEMAQSLKACGHREEHQFKRAMREHLRGFEGEHLFDSTWRALLEGPEHRYFEEPHSSQAFAVNLFAPLAQDEELALAFLREQCPELASGEMRVRVRLEAAIPGAGEWLGERGIGTSPDFVVEVEERGVWTGCVIGEVKLTEGEFGGCKGWFDEAHPPSRNEAREWCLEGGAVAGAPQRRCFMARQHGRRYWEYLDVERLRGLAEPCPFREDLYQLMRNHALAQAVVREVASVEWALFVVCAHEGNRAVRRLAAPVAGERDALKAFRAVAGEGAVESWDPRAMVARLARLEPKLAGWREWMMERYFPAWL